MLMQKNIEDPLKRERENNNNYLSPPMEPVEAGGKRSGTDRCPWRLPQPPQSGTP